MIIERLLKSGSLPMVVLLPIAFGLASLADPSAASGKFTKKSACATDLASCPKSGCALSDQDLSKDAQAAEALLNERKKTIPPTGTPIRLTFDDFHELQALADDRVGQDKPLSDKERATLRNLELPSKITVSEGDLVEIRGFVVQDSPRPKPSGPESVNCRLKGAANNDIHIPIVEESEDEEFGAIVVEMIPQGRLDSWKSGLLKRASKDARPVVVRGQLFYDNKHKVNGDSERDNGQPKRFSLWEIHPITEFWICIRADRKCDDSVAKKKDWKRLQDWKPGP